MERISPRYATYLDKFERVDDGKEEHGGEADKDGSVFGPTWEELSEERKEPLVRSPSGHDVERATDELERTAKCSSRLAGRAQEHDFVRERGCSK